MGEIRFLNRSDLVLELVKGIKHTEINLLILLIEVYLHNLACRDLGYFSIAASGKTNPLSF